MCTIIGANWAMAKTAITRLGIFSQNNIFGQNFASFVFTKIDS
jgi:hypothetical protein